MNEGRGYYCCGSEIESVSDAAKIAHRRFRGMINVKRKTVSSQM